MADKLKIMLVDDHYLVRMGLASIIALEPDMVVCAEASSGEQARALYRIHRPDVTLMDLRLPGMSGTETDPGHPPRVPRRAHRDDLDLHLRRRNLRRAPGGSDGLPREVGAARRADAARSGKRPPGQRHIPAEVAARLADRVSRIAAVDARNGRPAPAGRAAAATARSRRPWTSPKAPSSCTSAASSASSGQPTAPRRSPAPCSAALFSCRCSSVALICP